MKTATKLSDVWEFLKTNDITLADLHTLAQEINRLYSIKTNLLIQNFPSDIWMNIFPRVGSPSKKAECQFWLSCRTVSKAWHAVISKIDFSLLLLDNEILDDRTSLQKMLKLFKFSKLKLNRSNQPIPYPPSDQFPNPPISFYPIRSGLTATHPTARTLPATFLSPRQFVLPDQPGIPQYWRSFR